MRHQEVERLDNGHIAREGQSQVIVQAEWLQNPRT